VRAAGIANASDIHGMSVDHQGNYFLNWQSNFGRKGILEIHAIDISPLSFSVLKNVFSAKLCKRRLEILSFL
jgi:hypothetical protein